ncbi:MAG: tRNA epoxyqueuosine(34) reductase QueG [Phycisphaerales bacterium]|nr:tRNA epoxyqueuosine(34) reductase QueG [Phycisphaerales bacterium]
MMETDYKKIIKDTAVRLGFDYCGVAIAAFLEDDAKRLDKWLSQGLHGTMSYMERYFDLRVNPKKLMPSARSVITLLKNYYPAQLQKNNAPKISKYAYGKDYHFVIKQQLKIFLTDLQDQIGSFEGRGFVDSAPVLERAWAVKSGLGWVGKNGNLITPKTGSFFFIATLITDLPLLADTPFVHDFCGTCNRCVDACPTQAILPNKEIAANQCIAYFTIELKDLLPSYEVKEKLNNWMFGCDICQDICPWNRFAKAHEEEQFTPIPEILNLSTQEWQEMTKEIFNKVFKKSALKRAKFDKIKNNLR